MGNNNIMNYLKDADKDCQAIIGKSEQEIKDFISEYQTRFDGSINGNIYTTFGEFLYNALGKKINPQIKNKLLSIWVDEHLSEVTVTEDGVKRLMSEDNIIKYIAEKNSRDNYWTAGNRKTYRVTHATVGATMGMGYVTPGQTVRSIHIPKEKIFFYLTQEHVDLITNKQKRACAQEFLTFRDSFMKIRDKLAKNEVFDELNIPVETAIFKEVSVKDSIHNRDKSSASSKYLVHDKNTKNVANSIEVRMLNTGTNSGKDKIADLIDVSSRSLRSRLESRRYDGNTHAISIAAFHNDKNNNMTFFGAIHLQEKESLTPLKFEDIKDTRSICEFAKDIPSQYYVKEYSPATKNAATLQPAEGYILNWTDVIGHKEILASIDRRIKFFENASKTLHHLKKKHAALVFIHGIF